MCCLCKRIYFTIIWSLCKYNLLLKKNQINKQRNKNTFYTILLIHHTLLFLVSWSSHIFFSVKNRDSTVLSRCMPMRSSTWCSICRRLRNGNNPMRSSTCCGICSRSRNGNSFMRRSTCGRTWKSGRSGNNPMRRITCGTVLLSWILHNNPILSYVLSPASYPAN